jgi:transcriptional regulator with XRE-family HTH domain
MDPVAQNVKRLREARGWTQAELARRIGVKRPYVTMIEAGVRTVSLDLLRTLARVFHVKPGRLLE